jgi:aminopeptidase N
LVPFICVQIGLVGPDGQDLPLHLKATTHNSKHKGGKGSNKGTNSTSSKPVTSPEGIILNTGLQGHTSSSLMLLVDSWSQSFTFTRLPDKPYVSLLRDFSAPVRLEVEGDTDKALGFLAVHDSNPFAR